MIHNFKIVQVNYKYCDYLRKFDNKVIYNSGRKRMRPFIGVLFYIGKYEYFAPLSSPKAKHLYMKTSLDFIKIDYGRLGVINLNNMIPVMNNNYELYDLNSKTTNLAAQKHQKLLLEQLLWLNKNKAKIHKKTIDMNILNTIKRLNAIHIFLLF